MNFNAPARSGTQAWASLPALRPQRSPLEDCIDPPASYSSRKNSYSTAYGAPAPSPDKSRFSVVMSASPRSLAQYKAVDLNEKDDLERGQLVSDLSSRGVTRKRETPVPVPSIPGMNASSAMGTEQTSSPKKRAVSQIAGQLPQRPANRQPSASGTSTPQSTASKPRGRPKGWKPGMTFAQARDAEPQQPSAPPGRPPGRPPKPKTAKQLAAAGTAKRRGRPPRQPSPPPAEIFYRLRPDFSVFGCEWGGCRAELHNLGTLRKHVGVVHVARQKGDQDGRKRCMWRGCDRQVGFEEDDKLRRHIDEDHLVSFEWHMGDGPNNDCAIGSRAQDGDELPAYLKDADGNQVTPSIKDQEVEDLLTWKENRRKLKELLLRRDANLPSDDEDMSPAEEDVVL